MRLYALLDVGDDAVLRQFADGVDAPRMSLFDGTPQQSLGRYSPRLIALPEPPWPASGDPRDGGLAERLLELAEGRACVAWIVSDRPLDALAAHLRAWLDGVLLDADGSPLGDVLLRFFDPRVLPGFMDMLRPEQFGELMRPLVLWGTWLRTQRWQEWTPPATNPPYPLPRVQAYTLEQHARLDAATRTDRLHARLRAVAAREPDGDDARAFGENLFRLPPVEAFRRLDAILARGAKLGLRLDADLLLYAGLSLRFGPRFDEEPDVRAAITRAVGEPCLLVHALGDLPEQVWARAASLSRRTGLESAQPG